MTKWATHITGINAGCPLLRLGRSSGVAQFLVVSRNQPAPPPAIFFGSPFSNATP